MARVDRTPFLQLLDVYDVRQLICKQLSARDFLALANSTKELQSDFKADRWDMNKALRRFVSSPLSLRQLQADTGTLISGPFLLNFIETQPVYPVEVLQMYTYPRHKDEWDAQMVSQGCRAVPSDKEDTSTYRDASGLWVSIVWTENPIWHLLRGWHMTFEASIATWDKVYHIYPRPTLISEIAWGFGRLSDRHASTTRYHAWPMTRVIGIHTYDRISDHSNTLTAFRRIGDRSTLAIPLDTRNIVRPPINFQIEACEFWQELTPEGNFFIDAGHMLSLPLRFGYTRFFDGDVLANSEVCGPMAIVEKWILVDVLVWQLLALDEENRPEAYKTVWNIGNLHHVPDLSDIEDSLRATWQLPSSWEYMDHMLLKWSHDVRKNNRWQTETTLLEED